MRKKIDMSRTGQPADEELAQAAVWRALDEWEAAPVSEHFDARLYARIAALPQATWHARLTSWLKPWLARPAVPLGLASLAVAGGVFFSYLHPGGKPAAAPAVTVSALDADQIDATLDDLQTLRQFDADATPASKI